MIGNVHVVVQNRRVRFEFDLRRNITIIRGDSATGKTTLVSMIETYGRLGPDSGIEILCEKKCVTVNSSKWGLIIENTEDSIVFIDEENVFIKTKEFARKIRDSSNRYVIVTRENLPNLPYSVDEIYGIHTSGKFVDLKKTYNLFYRLYPKETSPDQPSPMADVVITEDSNSGHDFFHSVCAPGLLCLSAGGKTNIRKLVSEHPRENVLIIADGAAFGSEMGELALHAEKNPHIAFYLPESFEWIILASGLIDGNRIQEILEHPEDYVDSAQYFSWEQFFTSLLVQETKDSYLHYTKLKLNPVYLNSKERKAILGVMKVIWSRLGIT